MCCGNPERSFRTGAARSRDRFLPALRHTDRTPCCWGEGFGPPAEDEVRQIGFGEIRRPVRRAVPTNRKDDGNHDRGNRDRTDQCPAAAAAGRPPATLRVWAPRTWWRQRSTGARSPPQSGQHWRTLFRWRYWAWKRVGQDHFRQEVVEGADQATDVVASALVAELQRVARDRPQLRRQVLTIRHCAPETSTESASPSRRCRAVSTSSRTKSSGSAIRALPYSSSTVAHLGPMTTISTWQAATASVIRSTKLTPAPCPRP